MIKNFPDSLKAVLYSRLRSPLFIAFLMSFLAWNAQAILVVFSSLPVFTKIHYLEKVIYVSLEYKIINLFVIPFSSALTFIFIYPIPGELTYKYTQWRKSRLKDVKVKYEDMTPLTVKGSLIIRNQITDTELKYSNYVDDTNRKIADIENRHIKNAEQKYQI